MKKLYQVSFILTILVLSFLVEPLYSQRTKSSLGAGWQRKAEKGLKDNRYFFYFINSSITNLGDDEEKKAFKEAIQRDIIAQQLYMKFLFKESFTEIRHSQKILIDLYMKVITKDIKIGKKLLNGFAPAVVKSNNYLARHYLALGYRDITGAKNDMLMADNFRQTLYSMRLYKYVWAIKKAKHGKRYAFLALLEIKLPVEKKTKFAYLGFEKLKELISSVADDDKKSYYMIIHSDNYYRSKDEKSYFDLIWEKPKLHEIKEYEEYLKKS